MEGDNRLLVIFSGVLAALCLFLALGVWYSVYSLYEYREEFDELQNERTNYEALMKNMEDKNKNLVDITGLRIENTDTANDIVELYSQVRRVIENNNVNVVSMNTGENILTLQLQGDYYAIAKIFADWRMLPFASRINSLRITRDSTNPGHFVAANVILEAMRPE